MPRGKVSNKIGLKVFNEKYGNYTILESSGTNAKIQFESTGTICEISASCLSTNKVKDHMVPTFYGVGYLGRQTKNVRDVFANKALFLWAGILKRCYNNDYEARPNYQGCSVCDEWKSFANFLEWLREQDKLGYYQKDWQLDKDLLVHGNKVYSPETCVFLPFRLNSLLQVKKRSLGNYLPGVDYDKSRGKFKSSVVFNGERYYGKRRETEIEAFLDYKELKESLVREDSKNWEGIIDPRAVKALSEFSLDWVLEEKEAESQ